MKKATYKISFLPDNISINVEEGISLLEAARRAGIDLESSCGGGGTCNKCMVKLTGKSNPVRACQSFVASDLEITIPESSRFFRNKILQEGISRDLQVHPPVRKYRLQLPPPDVDDLRSDLERLQDCLSEVFEGNDNYREYMSQTGKITISRAALLELPLVLRANDFTVTVICHYNEIIALTEEEAHPLYGVAVDIGTTTVVARLMNLEDGQTMAIAADANPQIPFGADVISRISRSSEDGGLALLHDTIIQGINHLVAQLCEQASIDQRYIYEVTVVGNSAMQQLFLGIPVASLAQAPYVSTMKSAVHVPAKQLALQVNPHGYIYTMPTVAGHVGGDSVAVALSTAMKHSDSVNLALDIGTNGEIILGSKDRLVACSTAAGPAFEGARIRHGIRGTEGAIERVRIDKDVEISTIGQMPAKGICGSGLVDAISELLKCGIIDYTGRLLSGEELPPEMSSSLRSRIIKQDNAPAFILALPEQTASKQAIILTQRDVRECQLAKAAIEAGTSILMRQLNINLEQIERVYLAGAFGNYIRPESARRIGLLPDIPLAKIQPIGNAAAIGAVEVLLSSSARRHAEDLAANIEYIELAGRPDFQEVFGDSMFFPLKYSSVVSS